MSKVLVLYYSSYGHIEQMAQAIAEGARSTGAEVDIKRVPETVPEAVSRSAHFKLVQKAPVAAVAELVNYDAIIVGTGTQFGRISSQMAAFLDQAGGLWARGAFNGKVGAAFASTATQHGAGNDPVLDHHQLAALRYDHRRISIQPPGADDLERNRRRRPLWSDSHRRRRWLAPTHGDRIGGRPSPGGACRQDGEQAFWMSTNDRQRRCRISAPAIVRRPAAFSFSANHTGSFFFVSGFGSGPDPAKLSNGTRKRVFGFSQVRQCGDDVLRMFVTVVVRLCAVASASPAHHDKLALGARIPNDRRGGLRFGKACVISDTQRPFESHYLPVFSLDWGAPPQMAGPFS